MEKKRTLYATACEDPTTTQVADYILNGVPREGAEKVSVTRLLEDCDLKSLLLLLQRKTFRSASDFLDCRQLQVLITGNMTFRKMTLFNL